MNLPLKTGKPLDFKKTLLYALFPVHLSISDPDGSRRHTAKSKLNYISLQDLENYTYEVSSRICNYCKYLVTNRQHTLNSQNHL